ncbi:hypothetical protein [Aestuariivivens sediminicola]|uniref:hypothetical protein n=1 Tax=Aestuariivivens sediminicola TaxID=2913560 RepID=UPI001F55D5C7|nr:hypothetical protein [Aestuariivivens sediminicola]
MELNGLISTLPKEIKLLIGTFVIVLSIGFFTGLLFVGETSSASPKGIQEQYLGNEDEDAIEVMRFKKSDQEMLTLVHNHVLSMSIIFFLLGLIVYLTKLPKKFKLFIIIEPFFSVLLTFGGLYLLWKGMLWMTYVVMFSGVLMTLTFTFAVFIILYQLIIEKAN